MKGRTKKICLVSLGCSKNLADSENMLGELFSAGYDFTGDPALADIIILNTCAFLKKAREESFEVLENLAFMKKNAKCHRLILAGCLVPWLKENVHPLPSGVDGFLAPGEIGDVLSAVSGPQKMARSKNTGPAIRRPIPRVAGPVYVKIAEGCSNRCSYCLIPTLRGVYRSRRMEDIETEVRDAVSMGIKEINLISQDTTFYGKDIYGEYMLGTLLRKLVKIKGLCWIRILYAHPAHISMGLLDIISGEEKVCKYLDVPLQHIDDKILHRMNRGITEKRIYGVLDKIRKSVPDIVLRTTFITGFPGETEKAFLKLLDFMKEIRFERLGVFTYSKEKGTMSYGMNRHISKELKEKRRAAILRAQRNISMAFNKKKIGLITDVLIEGLSDDMIYGRTRWDAPDIDGRVYIKRSAAPNELQSIVKCRISGCSDYDLYGELI